MIVRSIQIESYKSIRQFECTFGTNLNILVGPNGCGKSSLLHFIAGLAGSDDAEVLIRNHEVGFLGLDIDLDGETYRFEHSGVLTPEVITRFKHKLDRRVNFSKTQYHEVFVDECVPSREGREQFLRFIGLLGEGVNVFHSRKSNDVIMPLGGGFESALDIFMLESPEGYPMLLDNPDMHLHIRSQELMAMFLNEAEHQTIIATHSPEMLIQGGNAISMAG